MKTLLTLSFIVENNKILLALKKRGFGEGRWNGYGGKVEEGETLEAAAKREVKEESGIEVTSVEKRGIHEFRFVSNPKDVLEVHTYLITGWSGEPEETEEMKPKWFPLQNIPYSEMWPDDIYWLPVFLKGEFFQTKFLFGEGDKVLEQEVDVVQKI